MTRWERFFLVLQRISSVLVILLAVAFLATLVVEWRMARAMEEGWVDDYYEPAFERTLPYVGQEIETAEGSLIAVFQEDEETAERVELGGITISNPSTGRSIEVAPADDANIVQFELIFDQGKDGQVVGYLATTATPEQYAQGRMDLVVGALPALTRNVVARNIRFSDLPRIRGDGSVGLMLWPEEGEAYLVAIRLKDGAVIDRARVKLPALKEDRLSQGSGIPDGPPRRLYRAS